MGEGPVLELRTFGGLRVLHRGQERAPLSDRPALLLAGLVAARGRTVRATELVDLIWPGDPPGSALNQLHRYIGELRRVLEPGLPVRSPGRIIERHNDGYRLLQAEVSLDLDTFEALVLRARRLASEHGDEAIGLLLQALTIAAQPAFTNLAELPPGHADIEGIEADRIGAATLLADCALESSAPDRVIPSIGRIAAQAPLNEVLQAKYIRLLARAGRASEGLAHYEAVVDTLRQTFGVDPGAALRAAHLEAVSPVAADVGPVATQARSSSVDQVSNLPASNPSYVDPPTSEERFARLLDQGVGVGTITVLHGGGGFGKTTLAVHLARLLEQRSGASSIFLDLRGFDPERDPVTPDAAVEVALTQLGVEHGDLSPDERERALRSAVIAAPLIAVLDSARDAEQIRPLLGGLSGATVIVTTRTLLQTLVVREGARLVQLDRWDERTSRMLLAERLGVTGSTAHHPALAGIVRACAGLPLALSIAAARCAGVEPSRWDRIARELNDGAGPLDALAIAAGSDDVRSVFATSLRVLDDSALTVFSRGALVPEASADIHALASVSGFDLDRTHAAVRVLLGSSLLRDAGDGSFGMHDLVRSYALELLSPEERAGAESRALSYIALTARHVWLLTGRPPVGDTSAPRIGSASIPPLADLSDARRWLARNEDWIDALKDVGVGLGLQRDVVTTYLDLRPLTSRQDVRSEIRTFSELEPWVEGLGDLALLGEMRAQLGALDGRAGRPEAAHRHYEAAIELFTSLDDVGGLAKTYRNMAADAARLKRFDDANRFATRAAEFAAASGNESLIGACGFIRLAIFGELRQYVRIVELAPHVIGILRRSPNMDLANALEVYAFAQYSAGDPAGALDSAREALAMLGRGDPERVEALGTTALAAASLGRVAECMDAIEQFHALIVNGSFDFDAEYPYDSVELRRRFDDAAEILSRSDSSITGRDSTAPC